MKRKYIILLLSIVMVLSVALAACSKSGGSFEWDEYTGPAVTGDFEAQTKVLNAVPAGKASEPSIQIHYRRNNPNDYKTWGFWLWTKSGTVGSDDTKAPYCWAINYQDDFGGVALYSFTKLGLTDTSENLGLIAKKAQKDWVKDGGDRFWDLSSSTLDENNYYHIYLIQGDDDLYYNSENINYAMSAGFTSESQIAITTKTPVTNVKLYEGDKVIADSKTDDTVSIRFNFANGKKPDMSKDYKVEVTFKIGAKVASCAVGMTALYDTDLFDNAYYFDGELGAIYSSGSTTFRVWSPVSTKIVLNIYQSGHAKETPQTQEMTKGDKGVWEVTVSGNLAEKYYTYTVYNPTYPTGMEIVDPYAKSAGLNGQRGQIVDFSKTNPAGWDSVTPHAYDANELVVWETHVADVTSSETWNGTPAYAKLFKGMWESGTKYTKDGVTVKTGFDHIKELGVNAVQLVPIFDQANDEVNVKFNWGYNPLNYNVLEGAYSTNARDGYVRITEFKELVMAYNKADINIIMDVVYNHVNSAIGSNFDVLMPGYYFRYTNGNLDSGSGCGNDTASNHSMFRKFMIDSVKFWAKEYKLGGFRFDLMGLHDIETMNQLAAELRKINPSIVIYGEPWDLTSSLPREDKVIQANFDKLEGVGQFNDQMRDALIKGGLNGATERGWATNKTTSGDVDKIVSGLKGITDGGSNYKINDLYKTVNYVTCHDNYTLYDRIIAAGFKTYDDRVKQMAVLANAVVLTSNGTSFMLAGEEFLRTKGGNHNSYESSYKVNELNYELKITNSDIFAKYQALIAFKTSFVKTLKLDSNQAVTDNYKVTTLDNGHVIKITIKTGSRTYVVIHSNGQTGSSVTENLAGYTLEYSSLDVTLTPTTPIEKFQTIIAYR